MQTGGFNWWFERRISNQRMEEGQQTQGVFVMGRQHSGNTFLTRLLGTSPNFFVDDNENSWFEQISVIEKAASLEDKAAFSTKHLLKGKSELAQAHLQEIQQWLAQHPDSNVYDLFLQSMKIVTLAEGKQHWILKATSYVFYAEEILENCPNVQLIYIVRNPLDLTASTKKRTDGKIDWLISTNLAWRKGVRIAQELSQKYPKRFLIVYYEKLVKGATELERIADFMSIEKISNYEDMPVVNTSDQPYITTQKKGLTTSRVYYFTKILSLGEIFFALRLAGGKELILKWYPDIPLPQKITLLGKVKGLHIFIWMTLLFFKKHFNIFSVYKMHRLYRRLKIMFFK